MRIKAHVVPLDDSKYYGTNVAIEIGQEKTSVNVWMPAHNDPSDAELAKHGYTREDWDNNVLVDYGWDKEPIRSWMITDNHYQSRTDVLVAGAISIALDGLDLPF